MEKAMKQAMQMAFVFGLVAFLGISVPKTAHGAEDAMGSIKPLLGLDLGFGSYNNDFGTKFTYGGHAAVRMSDFELGLAYRKAKLSSDDATSVSTDIEYTLGQLDYRMPMGPGHLTVGIEAGSGKVSANLDLGLVSLEGDSETKFAFGPRVGYQVPLSEHFELGATADYLTVSTSEKIHSLGLLVNAAYVF